MKFSTGTVLAFLVPFAANAAVVERALPVGHPIINNSFLTAANFTLRADIFPSGFAVPTQTLTLLPSGYSVGPTAVYGPDGAAVTAFPASVLDAVAAKPTETAPPPSGTTGTQGGPAPSPSQAGNDALSVTISSGALAALVFGIVMT